MPERSYSLGIFFLLLLLAVVPGIIYLVWGLIKGNCCPICHTPEKMMEGPRFGNNGDFSRGPC